MPAIQKLVEQVGVMDTVSVSQLVLWKQKKKNHIPVIPERHLQEVIKLLEKQQKNWLHPIAQYRVL